MKKSLNNILHQKYNRWTVIGDYEIITSPKGQNKTYWLCKCECGNIKKVYANSLVSGKSKSCGCLKTERLSRPHGHASRRNIYSCYRSKANRHGLVFKLTEEQFENIVKNNCFYCGKPPSNVHSQKRSNGEYVYNGIDRVNNKIGYELNNCVPSCKNCNLAKRTLTQSDFFDMVKKIYERHFLNEKI